MENRTQDVFLQEDQIMNKYFKKMLLESLSIFVGLPRMALTCISEASVPHAAIQSRKSFRGTFLTIFHSSFDLRSNASGVSRGKLGACLRR